jgi:hypothetical protein
LASSQVTPAGDYTAEITLWNAGTKLTALQFPLVINPKVT